MGIFREFSFKCYGTQMQGVMMTKLSLTFFLSYSLCTSLAEWHHPAINLKMEFHVLQSSIGRRLSLQLQRSSFKGHIHLIHLLMGLLPERENNRLVPVKINVCSRCRDTDEVDVKSVFHTRRMGGRDVVKYGSSNSSEAHQEGHARRSSFMLKQNALKCRSIHHSN